MTWQDYESTVKNIYETLGKAVEVKIECYGASCKRIGKSTVSHQIDILTSHSDGVHIYYTAIECKYWDQKVNKDIVMKVEAITNDCNFDKTVIVLKIGFTVDAITYAKFINVRLVELKEGNISISGNKLIKFYMNMEISKPTLYNVTLFLDKKDKEKEKNIMADQNIYTYIIIKPNKEKIELKEFFLDFLNTKVLNNYIDNLLTDTIKFEKGSKLKHPSMRKPLNINAIQLAGYNLKYTMIDSDYFENKVWMIMKLLFEQKHYIVTFDGNIEEEKPSESIQLTVGQKSRIEMKPIIKKFIIAN